MKVALHTLGCKLNQAETEKLARELLEAGHRPVGNVSEADVCILNTCTVTHVADSKSRRWLRAAHRRNPEAWLVATGCYAERKPEELVGIEGVSLVVGNNEKSCFLRLVENVGRSSFPDSADGGLHKKVKIGRTRAFIKVQDGCSRSCAYCIVPKVRGAEKSRPAGQVVTEVKQRVGEGCQEVVLTGTEVGAYQDGLGLKGLLERILTETGVPRLRLSSLQPQEISPGLLELWGDGRLCPHFHLSLQSGDDRVLGRMRRGYSAAGYERAVRLIRSVVPEAAISTDIIVGFPGETEAEFEQSYDFCRNQGFSRIHVFPYSLRPGTEASEMPGQLGARVKKERSEKMLVLAQESSFKFEEQFAGCTMPVLWEEKTDGVWSGFTGNYIRAYTRSDRELANTILPVKLAKLT